MSFAGNVFLISAGGIVWALHFAALYGFAALACARGFAPAIPWFTAAATLAAIVAAAAVLWLGWRRRAAFEGWTGATLAALALVAIAWQAVPVYIVPLCATY